MEHSPEISIIVPVYNAIPYLRPCLDSIASQSFSDWECILVDDGSCDGSELICDEYAARDTRFRVVHRANGGVAAARNTGLAACRGKYIGWVDSDDLIHEGLFQRLHSLIIEHDADVAQVGMESLYVSHTSPRPFVETVVVYNRKQTVAELLNGKQIESYLWNKLFRRSVFDFVFPEGMTFEDVYVSPLWLRNVGKMVCAPDILYSYRKRKGSISKRFVETRIDFIHAMLNCAQQLQEIEKEDVIDRLANIYVWKGFVRTGKWMARFEEDPKARREVIKKISVLAKTAPNPKSEYLGTKLWGRANLLRNYPSIFIKYIRIQFRKDPSNNDLF
ncbi:glycosyltransferase [bacterium]|nr:glycosyltransferase [bacterium]